MSIASANSRRCSTSQATSDWSRLRGRRLDRRERRAQVVADRLQQRRCAAGRPRRGGRPRRPRLGADGPEGPAPGSTGSVCSTRWSSADRRAPRRTSTVLPSSARSHVSPSKGPVGGSGPELASTIQPSSRLDSSDTDWSEKVDAELVEQSGHRVGLADRGCRWSGPARPPRRGPACASRLRVVTRSMSTLAPTAAATKTTSATTFSGSPTVNVWNGGDEEPVDAAARRTTAAATPTTTPPRTAMTTVDDEEQQQVGGQREVFAAGGQDGGQQRQADDGEHDGGDLSPPRRAPPQPSAGAGSGRGRRRRARVVAAGADDVHVEAVRRGARWRRSRRPATSSCQRLRRLAPTTTWVAFSERAKSTSAPATRSPTTSR